jgi:type II secretory pathway predicted ATPase ExeA
MYEAHFGLNSRPFGAKAEGPQIFTGPQQVRAVQGVQKGLVAQDAVVTVSGPIGAGKTTIVAKALETVKPNRMAAWIGRMTLAQDELLDLLLAGFGVRQKVNGSVRRFALFRRIMAERAAAGAAVAVVVEDAIRLGADTLAELEALTAADTGDAIGANIILMGPPELSQFLKDPAVARLKQRIRRRENVAAFSQAEVTGYLKHCMRQAGGDYDALFEPGVDQIIFRCSEGVPRVVNTLCENALTAAMEAGQRRITTGLMHEVASDNYTYEGPPPDFATAPEIDSEAAPASEPVDDAPAGNDAFAIDEDALPPAARNIVVESGRYPELPESPDESPEAAAAPAPAVSTRPAAIGKPMPQPKPAAPVEQLADPGPETVTTPAANEDKSANPLPDTGSETAEAAANEAGEPEIPELINDTQPELSALPAPVTDDAIEPPAPPAVEDESSAVPEAGTDEAGTADDETFDLDAALSIDIDDTNVMQGITPNLDALGKDNAEPPVAEKSVLKPDSDDLPTLSDSMRVDVDKEVKKARKAESAAQQAAPKPAPLPTAAAGAKSSATAADPAPDTKPAKAQKSASRPPQQPASAAGPLPSGPGRSPDPEPADAAKAATNTAEESSPSEKQAEPPVSEMTARIRSIDVGRRGSDVDSLEAALEAAKKGNLDDLTAPPPAPQVNGAAPAASEPTPQLPEITLDKELEEKQRKKREELEKYAREISSASSLEEFSDTMAETLFGNEDLNAIAAEVIANPPDDHELAEPPPAGPSPVLLDDKEVPGEDPASIALELEPETVAAKAGPETGGPLRESQAMRADMLNSFKGGVGGATAAAPVAEKVELGQKLPQDSSPSTNGSPPGSIEDQMDTVMTQTLAALDISKMADQVVEGEAAEEKPKKKAGGLFSRFRKSS